MYEKGDVRTRGAADDAPSAVCAKVALVADAHERFGSDVGVAYRTANLVQSRVQELKYDIRTTFRHTSRINDQ